MMNRSICDLCILVNGTYFPRMTFRNKPGDRERFLTLLRQIRVDAGLRQEDLASKLGQPQSFVSRCESGERRVDILELREICGALGTTLSDFIRRMEGEVD